MADSRRGTQQPEDASQRELELARLLGQYVDRWANDQDSDVDSFLCEHPDAAPALADELRTLEHLGAFVDESPPLRVFGDFKLVGVAGSGGMGVVYDAWQMSLERRVALKILAPSLVADATSLERFRREAKAAASLSHPAIVSVYATGIHEGTPYIALEFAVGRTLHEILRLLRQRAELPAGTQPTPEDLLDLSSLSFFLTHKSAIRQSEDTSAYIEQALMDSTGSFHAPRADVPCASPSKILGKLNGAYCKEIAQSFCSAVEGLQHAHARGVIHRDVKPSNLMLDPHGRLRILDFGLAWIEGQVSLTRTRQRLGTPAYMSPEQVRGHSDSLEPATDIYSIGVTLYEMLSWRLPFTGATVEHVLQQIASTDPPPLRRWNPQVPKDLETIILKCLQKDPAARYGTAEALGQDLQRFVRGDPIEARRPPLVERLSRRAWRSKRRIGEVAIALALIVTLGLLTYRHFDAEKQARIEEYRETVGEAVVKILKAQRLQPRVQMARVPSEGVLLGETLDKVTAPSRLNDGSSRSFESGPNLFEVGPAIRDLAGAPLEEAVALLEEAIGNFPEKPIAYYHLSRAQLLRGEDDKAQTTLENLLDLDPSFLPALSLRAALAEKAGNATAATTIAEVESLAAREESRWSPAWLAAQRAVVARQWKEANKSFNRLRPLQRQGDEPHIGYNVETWLGRGVARQSVGEFVLALPDFGAGIEVLEDPLEARLLLGKALYLCDQKTRAAEDFEAFFTESEGSSLQSSSKIAEAIALTYDELGEFQSALEWSRRMAESPRRSLMEAVYHSHLGAHEEAWVAGQRAMALRPADSQVCLTLGNLLLARHSDLQEAGDEAALPDEETLEAMSHQLLVDAKEWYQKSARLAPESPRPFVALGVCLEMEGDLDAARERFLEATRKAPAHYEAYYNLARIASKLGKIPESITLYEKTIDLNPGSALAFNNLGTLLDRQGDPEDSLALYERAVELAFDLGSAHYNLAWSYHRLGRYGDAASEYEQARRFGVDTAILHSNLAVCLQRQGNADEAIEEYRKAIRREPMYSTAHHDLGTALLGRQRYGEAIKAFHKAIKLLPTAADARLHLGWAYKGNEQWSNAFASFEEAIRLAPGYDTAHGFLSELILEKAKYFEFNNDDRRRMNTWLEPASRIPGAWDTVKWLLAENRAALRPDITSYGSVDALFDEGELLVSTDSTWRYWQGSGAPSASEEWALSEFEDGSWERVVGPVDPTKDRGVDLLLTSPQEGWTSLYLRQSFEVSEPGRITDMLLSAKLSHGYVVWLNGQEVARQRAGAFGEPLALDSRASRKDPKPWAIEEHGIDAKLLRHGKNVIAIQLLKHSEEDIDLVVDVAVVACPPGSEGVRDRAAAALEAYRPVCRDPALLAYFDGRLFAHDGNPAEARHKFEHVQARGERSAEPYLQLALCHTRAERYGMADTVLRRALSVRTGGDSRLWDTWLNLALIQLELPVQTALELAAAVPAPSDGVRDRYAEDVFWLLERLAADEPIRIDCGGRNHIEEGQEWSKDRFFRAGAPSHLAELSKPKMAVATAMQSERYFWERGTRVTAYRVPLPKGTYEVVLHFAEGYHKGAGRRFFGVLLEAEAVLSKYEPIAQGFGVVQSQVFEVPVRDGFLDIQFRRLVGDPNLLALEIHGRSSADK